MKYLAILGLILLAKPTWADAPEIEAATAQQQGNSWSISVTLRHADTGWDDYADGWRIESEDGTELGVRVLFHPHVDEQPFTRSLSGVLLPPGTTHVFIRARSLTTGWGDDRYELALP